MGMPPGCRQSRRPEKCTRFGVGRQYGDLLRHLIGLALEADRGGRIDGVEALKRPTVKMVKVRELHGGQSVAASPDEYEEIENAKGLTCE